MSKFTIYSTRMKATAKNDLWLFTMSTPVSNNFMILSWTFYEHKDLRVFDTTAWCGLGYISLTSSEVQAFTGSIDPFIQSIICEDYGTIMSSYLV